jgi:hypothetical protein
MNTSLQNALIFLVYGVALGGTIVLAHVGLLDPQLEAGLVGAVVTHMGLNYAPSNGSTGAAVSEVKKTS